MDTNSSPILYIHSEAARTWIWWDWCRGGGAGRRWGPASRPRCFSPCLPTRSERAETATQHNFTVQSLTWLLHLCRPLLSAFSHVGQNYYLNSVVTEEEASICSSGHLQTGGAAPHWWLPHQKGEGSTLAVLVTLAEDVWKKRRREKFDFLFRLHLFKYEFNSLP